MALVGSPIGKPWGRRLPVSVGAALGPVADILLDFVNSIYRVDGVSYATAALAGFTGTGTFDATGYTATGTQRLTGTVNLPGDFIVFSDYALGDVNTNRQLWNHQGPNQTGVSSGGGFITANFLQTTNATKNANGSSGSISKVTFNNDPVQTGGALGPQGSATFYIGNNSGSTQPWAVPIRKIAIYKQTLSDAQIQALS